MEYLKAEHAQGFLLETRIDVGIHYEGWALSDVTNYIKKLGYNADAAEELYNLIEKGAN